MITRHVICLVDGDDPFNCTYRVTRDLVTQTQTRIQACEQKYLPPQICHGYHLHIGWG